MNRIFLLITVFIYNFSFSQMTNTKGYGYCHTLSHQRTVTDSSAVLIIVNGLIVSESEVSTFYPCDILSFRILKPVEASALYGVQGINGAIIIETRSIINTRIRVKDCLFNLPIQSVTITLSSNFGKDSIVLISNDSGFVATNKLQRNIEYEIRVTAIGYKTDVRKIKAGENAEIGLSRNIITLPEVIISAIDCGRRISCGSMRVIRSYAYQDQPVENNQVKIYPNPARSNSNLHIQLNQNGPGNFYLQLFNASGQSVFNKEVFLESSLLSLELPNLETGNYFLKLTNKDTIKFFTSKLIIKK